MSLASPNKILIAITTAALFSLVVEGALATWKIVSLEYEKQVLEDSINNPMTGFIARSLTCEMNIQELRNTITSVASERRIAVNTNAAALKELLEEVRGFKNSSNKACQQKS